MTTHLQQAISLIKAGKKQEGGRLLNQVLKADPTNEAAWLWAAHTVRTDEKRIYCLKQALALNPQNQKVRQALAKLEAHAAAAAPPPDPTAAPAAAQQHPQPPTSRVAENVWLNLKGTLASKLVVLEPEGVIVATPDEKALQQIQAQLRQGHPLTEIPGGDVTGIPLDSIVAARALQHTRTLSIQRQVKDKVKSTVVSFDDAASRDDFVHALRTKLEPAFQYELQKSSPIQVLVSTSFIMLLAGVLTYVFYTFAVAVQTGATGLPRGGSGLTKIIALAAFTLSNTIGPIGIAIIGGLFILLSFIWMVRSMQKPPVLMTLTKQEK